MFSLLSFECPSICGCFKEGLNRRGGGRSLWRLTVKNKSFWRMRIKFWVIWRLTVNSRSYLEGKVAPCSSFCLFVHSWRKTTPEVTFYDTGSVNRRNSVLSLPGFISVKTSLINTKLVNFVNLGLLFLTMGISSCLSHNLQTRTYISRFWLEIGQYWRETHNALITVEPPVATTSRKRPLPLSDQFSNIPKVSQSITIFRTSCKPPPLVSDRNHF